MSDASTINQRQRRPGLVGLVFSLLGHIVAVLLTSLLLGFIFEWVGIAFFWPEQGAEHSKNMMRTELDWFSVQFTQSLLLAEPVQTAGDWLTRIHQWVFVDTGFTRWIARAAQSGDSQSLGYQIYFYLRAYIDSTVYVTLTFVLRLLLLLLTLPLFILAVMVGMVEGLVRRDIRRFGSGYESGFLYHHAKRSLGPIFITAWLLYLSLPFSVHPNIILLPAAIILGGSVSLMVAMFKKYL